MTHDQLHTHGPDELAMLRADCDKWHKAYDRVLEEHMRFADRAIELEKENANLKRDKGMRERRLRRALWLAMAERAADRARIFYFNDLETMLDIDGFSHDPKKKKGHKKLTARDWRIIWLKVERKCRAKAEVYK